MTLAAMLARAPVVTIQRRAPQGTDAYGNTALVVVSEAQHRGYLEQGKAEEVEVDQQTYVTDWRFITDAGVELAGWDRIVSTHGTHEVIGRPWLVQNPRLGTVSHIEARLRLVEG